MKTSNFTVTLGKWELIKHNTVLTRLVFVHHHHSKGLPCHTVDCFPFVQSFIAWSQYLPYECLLSKEDVIVIEILVRIPLRITQWLIVLGTNSVNILGSNKLGTHVC